MLTTLFMGLAVLVLWSGGLFCLLTAITFFLIAAEALLKIVVSAILGEEDNDAL